MVLKYGMSENLGLVFYSDQNKSIKLSERTKQRVDHEVSSILNQQYSFAKKILTEHKSEHHYLAKALVEYETLSLEEVKLVISGKKLNKLN